MTRVTTYSPSFSIETRICFPSFPYLTALFSNLLDNAVDAAKNIPNSFIELNISAHSHNSIVISMVNSCKKDPFTRSHRLTSTKKDKQNHGYGMKSIERVIKKYNGNSRFYFNQESCTFHAVIILSFNSI